MCTPSSCIKILDTRASFFFCQWAYYFGRTEPCNSFCLFCSLTKVKKKNGKNLQAWFISIMCGIISSSVGHARNRARDFSIRTRYEFNRPKLYTVYPGIQSQIVISCLHGLKRVSLYSMLTLDLLAGVFNSSQKCAIAANCITCYFQMCDKYNGYKPGYIYVFLLMVVICKLNIIFLWFSSFSKT